MPKKSSLVSNKKICGFMGSKLKALIGKKGNNKEIEKKASLLFFLFLFSSSFLFANTTTSTYGQDSKNLTHGELEIEQKRLNLDEQRYADERERREREDERREAAERRARDRERLADLKEDRREAERLADKEQDALEERAEEMEEAMKERKEECDQAEEDVKTALDEQDEKKSELEQEFYDLEEKITDLEGQNAEAEIKVKTEIENLNKEVSQNTEELKEAMGKELQSIEQEINQLQNSISQLHDALEKVEEQRLTTFYARRKQQNEFYSACFGKALEQTENEKRIFYKRKRSNTLRRKNIGALISGSKAQTRSQFSGRFNHFLNLCLKNQAALLQKRNQENEYQLMLEKLNRQEARAEEKIAEVKSQIDHLKHAGKAEVLRKYKEKMSQAVKNFEQAYGSLTENHQTRQNQVIQEIGKIKQQQALVLRDRAENAIPEQTRSTITHYQCSSGGEYQGLNQANMFPLPTPSLFPSRNGARGYSEASRGVK